MLTRNQVVLFVVNESTEQDSAIESATIFRPYDAVTANSALPYKAADRFGDLDISQSWKSTWKMLDRPTSGLYTGTALPTEKFYIGTVSHIRKMLDEIIDKARAEVIETIPDWVEHFDKTECMIVKNSSDGFTVVSNELQVSLAHSSSKEALSEWLNNY